MSETERALLIRIKGILLLAVDLIDRECKLGKYAAPIIKELEGDTVTVAGFPSTSMD